LVIGNWGGGRVDWGMLAIGKAFGLLGRLRRGAPGAFGAGGAGEAYAAKYLRKRGIS